MYSLYFKNAKGRRILVRDGIATDDEVFSSIRDFIYSKNPNYKIYYFRSWGENPVVYDVGSHSEFFYLYKD